MKKKTIALVSSLALLALMLTACGGDAGGSSSAGGGTSTPASTAAPSSTADVSAEADPSVADSSTPAADDSSTPAADDSSAAQQADGIGTWSVSVTGPDGDVAFTNAEAAALTPVTVEMTITNSNGEAKTNEYTGVTLKSLLESLGITEVPNGVTVMADDDFAAEYSAELAMADDTILAWAINGELIDSDQPVRMCPGQGTGNQFVKNCAKVIVN